MRPTIFVNIAAYRDPECGPTVADLMAKARHPEAITIGLVLQAEPEDHVHIFPANVRILAVKASESLGVCWARSRGYRELWDGQDYVLQIDSHMRFAQDWDVKMLAQLAQCPSGRPLLTTYPAPYVPGRPLGMAMLGPFASHFGPDGHLNQWPRWLSDPPPLPSPTALLAGCFVFADARWIADVPYDPHLYFSGEESTLAVRLWTCGWDMFGPTEPLVWHRHDDRSDGGRGWPRHWNDHELWWQADVRARARANHLLAGTPAETDALAEIDRYGLGTVRTLAAYQEWSGIDFQARTIEPRARYGIWTAYEISHQRGIGLNPALSALTGDWACRT